MRRVVLYAVAILMLSVACKKTEGNENKRWEQANKDVDELTVLYPGFKAALEQQRTEAKTAMEAAKAVEDKDSRISKMSSANNKLTGGFITQLKGVDAKKKAIQAKIVQVTGGAGDKADRASAQQAAENAKKVIAKVEATLKKGAPDVKSARVIMKQVTADLQSATSNLGMAAKMAQQKKDAKNPKAKTGTGAATTLVAPPKAAKWTCEYCDHENKGDATHCAQCNALRPKTKKPKK